MGRAWDAGFFVLLGWMTFAPPLEVAGLFRYHSRLTMFGKQGPLVRIQEDCKMNLVDAVELYYQDKRLPRPIRRILTDICTSAARGETINGIARRLSLDVLEVRDVIRKDQELTGQHQDQRRAHA
jgi:hypothetical protein